MSGAPGLGLRRKVGDANAAPMQTQPPGTAPNPRPLLWFQLQIWVSQTQRGGLVVCL